MIFFDRPCTIQALYLEVFLMLPQTDSLVQWWKLQACLENQILRVCPPLWHPSFRKTKCFFLAHLWRFNIVGGLRDREVAYSASDSQGSSFESCVWRADSVISFIAPSSEVVLAQLSLYVHKGGLKPNSFHFTRCFLCNMQTLCSACAVYWCQPSIQRWISSVSTSKTLEQHCPSVELTCM